MDGEIRFHVVIIMVFSSLHYTITIYTVLPSAVSSSLSIFIHTPNLPVVITSIQKWQSENFSVLFTLLYVRQCIPKKQRVKEGLYTYLSIFFFSSLYLPPLSPCSPIIHPPHLHAPIPIFNTLSQHPIPNIVSDIPPYAIYKYPLSSQPIFHQKLAPITHHTISGSPGSCSFLMHLYLYWWDKWVRVFKNLEVSEEKRADVRIWEDWKDRCCFL